MSDRSSDPNSDRSPPRGAIALLEAELAETLAAVSGSFAEVRKFDDSDGRARDDFGTKRSAAVKDAVNLLAVSAQLGNAIAKIKGQYNHNVNVLRGEIWPPPRRAVLKPATFAEGRPTAEAVSEALAASPAAVDEGTPSPEM